MKSQKLFTLALSCLLLLETPFTSMAAPSVSTPEAPGAAITASANSTDSGTNSLTLTSSAKAAKSASLKLNKTSVTVYTENTYRLKVSGKSSAKITWKSSKSKIATVDKNGTVTGMKPGKATITASLPGAKASCEVTVRKNPHKLNRESQILILGDSATLYLSNVSKEDSVSFRLADPSSEVVDITSSGNKCKITAENPGTVTLEAVCTTLENNQKITSKGVCTVQVLEKGIDQQQVSMAVDTAKSFTLDNIEKPGFTITNTSWASSNSQIASVTPTSGIVTGKQPGSAQITATVNYSDGTSSTFPTTVRISDPEITSSSTVLSLGKTRKIKLTGTNAFSTVKWKVKKSSLATIKEDGTVTAGNTAGKTTIIAQVDGKTIKHQLIVTNPQLTSTSKLLAVGKKIKVPLTGISSKSKITYKSKKTSVAKVDKSGRITGRSAGSTDIIINADGVSFKFHVDVASKRALQACKTGYKIMYSSSYSQGRRMSSGYYDCSSLVFRAYGCDSKLLGGTSSWAPTAASMAAHLERSGKVIAYKGIDSSKLLPGDLIFYRMRRGSNGRYRNIYHVSMYYGDGYRLEKPLRAYYKESNITMIARPLKK
ncbi:Ig-like domain-containing protein [Petralouisia muris]|uniref:Ig-like domain-containing protein n=1 Tax=Petralouisia muris TaxID=3032872 RepID=UPI0014414CAB|nr:Ig-like domain-containing protein [Petralouisia muris]